MRCVKNYSLCLTSGHKSSDMHRLLFPQFTKMLSTRPTDIPLHLPRIFLLWLQPSKILEVVVSDPSVVLTVVSLSVHQHLHAEWKLNIRHDMNQIFPLPMWFTGKHLLWQGGGWCRNQSFTMDICGRGGRPHRWYSSYCVELVNSSSRLLNWLSIYFFSLL